MNLLQLCFFFSLCIHFQKKSRGCYHASWGGSCQSKYYQNYLTHERVFVHSSNLRTETTPYDLSDQSQLINTTRKTNIRHCINTENCSEAVSALQLHNTYLWAACGLIISTGKKRGLWETLIYFCFLSFSAFTLREKLLPSWGLLHPQNNNSKLHTKLLISSYCSAPLHWKSPRPSFLKSCL